MILCFSKTALAFTFCCLLFNSCAVLSKIDQQDKYVHSIQKPIEGQKHTARQLKQFMDSEQYEAAINLFSTRQQVEIRALQKNTDRFSYWCLAWTFDDTKLARYISRIDKGAGDFTFESGMWKIDEK